MKKIPFFHTVFTLMILLAAPALRAQPDPPGQSPGSGFALLELFTSEGCSSCPPADEIVAHIASLYPNRILVLSFHVDYWDRLGWKDIYSSPEYTRRQKQYAETMGLNNIYTPQVIINGEKEFLGSDEKKLKKTIDENIAHASTPAFEATARGNAGKSISISFSKFDRNNDILYFSLVQKHAESSVKNGENAGRHLQHINIVRSLTETKKSKGALTIDIPAGLTEKDCKIIAFIQDPESLHIIAATEIPIQ